MLNKVKKRSLKSGLFFVRKLPQIQRLKQQFSLRATAKDKYITIIEQCKALAAAKAFFVVQIYALFLQLLKISYYLLPYKKIKNISCSVPLWQKYCRYI